MASSSTAPYTVFISHAGTDKHTIAFPLRKLLLSHNITAFVGEADMDPGTEAEKAMIDAMETVKSAVVVLSPEFVARKWPMKELMCFLRRREETSEDDECLPVIIPFFYRLNVKDLYDEPRLDRVDESGESLYLASRFLQRMNNREPEARVAEIKAALKKLHGIMGVRNDGKVTNDHAYEMKLKREKLLRTLCEKVRKDVLAAKSDTSSKELKGENKSDATPIVESVHHVLSKRQRDYSVFLPAPDTDFPLFQVIRILPDPSERSDSPRSTLVNLKSSFERLEPHIEDRTMIDAFFSEFQISRLNPVDSEIPPEFHHVSEESLRHAGVIILPPLLGTSASRTRTTPPQIRLQRRYSQSYEGGPELRTLLRKYARPIFRIILQGLHGTEDFPSAPGEKGKLAIVTARIISTIGVPRTRPVGLSAGISSAGLDEEYHSLYGVTGLRFIEFPIECIDEGNWRIYGSISVCDDNYVNQVDDSFTEERDQEPSSTRDTKYQVFISHAREDKGTIAFPLRDMLQEKGITAFVDDKDLSLGGDAQQEMFAAMESAHVGLMVLSPEFVAREWPMKELLCFLKRREEAASSGASYPIIVPFFYRLSISDLYAEPQLDRKKDDGTSLYESSRFSERRDRGDPEANIETIQRALRKLHGIQGVRNDLDATNANDPVMYTRRELLLKLTCDKIVEVLSQAERRSA